MHKILICFVILCCASCSSTGRFDNATVEDFQIFRDYRLPTEDPDPQPAWSPSDYRIFVCSKQGLGILDEGSGNQRFYNTTDASRIGWPTWLDDERIVVGSPEFMVKTDEGEITQSHVKVRMIKSNAFKLEEVGFIGDINAYYTRAWNDAELLAQKGESIIKIKALSGDWEEYDLGFFAEPQRDGSGVCYTTVPIIATDYWTGKTDNGDLIVRWREGLTHIFPNCFQARWCADGGIVATRLKDTIPKHADWHSVDTDVVYIAPESDKLRVIKEHAHSPAPNPVCPIVACVGRAGYLYLANLKTDGDVELVPEGDRPQWSHDGERLLTEVPGLDKTINLRVWVFRNKNEAAKQAE